MVSGIALSIAFLCLFEASIFKKDFFSPARVYIFTQSFTLGIAYLKLSPQMTDFHILTWAVFLGGALSFVIGSYATKLIFNVKVPDSYKKIDNFNGYKWNFHCFFAFILFLAGLLPIRRFMDYAGGIPLFSSKVVEIMSQKAGSIAGWLLYPITSVSFVVALFGIASFSSINPYKYLRYFSRFMIVLQILVLVFFFPSRGLIFMSIAFLAIMWNYLRKPISSKILLLGVVILLGIFVAVGYVRNQYGTGTFQSFAIDKIIQLPYNYIANNFWNLDYALNPQILVAGHPSTYGIDHFFAPVPLIGNSLRKPLGWDDVFNKSIAKQPELNSVNYLWEIYKDFGGIGVAFVPFLWGILITWLYMRLKTNLQMKFLLFYSFAITMVSLWCFNICYKNSPVYGFWIIATFGIAELCQKKKSIEDAI